MNIDISSIPATIINTNGQRTKDWYEARKGVITASKFNDIIRGSEDTWEKLKLEIAMGSNAIPDNKYIRIGRHAEPHILNRLIEDLKIHHAVKSMAIDFASMLQHPYIGCSPDSLLEIDGELHLVEIKTAIAKKSGTHKVNTASRKQVYKYHKAQVQGQMMVMGISKSIYAVCDLTHTDSYAHLPNEELEKEVSNSVTHCVYTQQDQEYTSYLLNRLLEFKDFCKL